MSKEVWHSTSYVGVRYREHPTKKHNGKPDRYYVIRYKRGKNLVGEGAGWNSDGAAGRLAIRGTPLIVIKEPMGPKSIARTERYSHLVPDMKRKAVTNLFNPEQDR